MEMIAALALLGLLFLFFEFFMPGIVLALFGVILLMASITLFFLTWGALCAVGYLGVLLIMVLAVCKGALRWIRKTKASGSFYHDQDQEGYAVSLLDQKMIGSEGVALTELKPSGHILVGGQKLQALSQLEYIPKEAPIVVIGGQGAHFIVRKKT
jgi:membrane-bound serine protease (ClpP class)